MRIHYLQHVPFEGLGSLTDEFEYRGYQVSACHLYRGDTLPELDEFDWLVVMGGPMGADDEADYPWMSAEKRLIHQAINADKRVLGICLGAQLMARALGAAVTAGTGREIGWFPIAPTDSADPYWHPVFEHSPTVFHWHSNRFEIPPGASHLARSTACETQAFSLGPRVLGLQFHLETTPEAALAMTRHCADELDGSEWVQTASQITAPSAPFGAINALMSQVVSLMAH